MLYISDIVTESMFAESANEIYRRRLTCPEVVELISEQPYKIMEFPTARFPMMPKLIKMRQELGIPIEVRPPDVERLKLQAGDAVLYIQYIARRNSEDQMRFSLWEIE